MIPLSDSDVQRHGRPYMTIGIIAVNAVVFLYEFTLGDFGQTRFFHEWGLVPAKLTQGLSEFGPFCDGQLFRNSFGNVVCQGTVVRLEAPNPAWATMFSAMFVHGGLMHFGGNMLYLWVFGDNIEDRLGHWKYLSFYLTCGVAATWAQVAINTDSQVPTIGASGAIAGVLGAYLLLFPYSRINTLVLMYFIMVIRVPALFMLGFWFFLQNFFQGLGSLGATDGGVAYWAHIGGFVAGILIIALYLKATGHSVWPSAQRFPWRWSRQ
jgi:membrane associated rhomboid family serine protease